MITTKHLIHPGKRYFSIALFFISAVVLLSSCSGTKSLTGCRNAPHSLFTAKEKHSNKNADPKKYAGNKASSGTVAANGFTNTPLKKNLNDSTAVIQHAASTLHDNNNKINNDIKQSENGKNLSKKDIASAKSFSGKKIYNQFKPKPHEKKARGNDPVPRTEPLGITSMGLGIIGLIFFPAGICAIILGFISLSKINRQPDVYNGTGFAVAGIICGFVGLLIGFFAFLLILLISM